MNLTYRCVGDKIEVREAEDKALVVRGYASVFNRETDIGWFKEVVRPGAFKRSLVERNVVALWGHNHCEVLGNTRAGTLTAIEDDKGLLIEARLPEFARGYYESIKRGDVDGMSFGFVVPENGDVWHDEDRNNVTRELVDVDLYEVSFTAFPAYKDTSVLARSDIEAYEEYIKLKKYTKSDILAYYHQKLNFYEKGL